MAWAPGSVQPAPVAVGALLLESREHHALCALDLGLCFTHRVAAGTLGHCIYEFFARRDDRRGEVLGVLRPEGPHVDGHNSRRTVDVGRHHRTPIVRQLFEARVRGEPRPEIGLGPAVNDPWIQVWRQIGEDSRAPDVGRDYIRILPGHRRNAPNEPGAGRRRFVVSLLRSRTARSAPQSALRPHTGRRRQRPDRALRPGSERQPRR